MLRSRTSHGAYAEYVTAPPASFARKPRVDRPCTGGRPPPGRAHRLAGPGGHRGLTAGQRVLVACRRGRSRPSAVQVAKARGAHVIGTARRPSTSFVRSLGADEVIDYPVVDFASIGRDVDVVLDTIGGDYRAAFTAPPCATAGLSSRCCRSRPEVTGRGGRALGVARPGPMLVEADRRRDDTAIADPVTRWASSGPVIAATFPLADAAEAHALGDDRPGRRGSWRLTLTR